MSLEQDKQAYHGSNPALVSRLVGEAVGEDLSKRHGHARAADGRAIQSGGPQFPDRSRIWARDIRQHVRATESMQMN